MLTPPAADHAADAVAALSAAVQSHQPLEGYYLAEAQVHATLALAAEQRTANLIAFVQVAGDPMTHDQATKRDALVDEVARRLSLLPAETPEDAR